MSKGPSGGAKYEQGTGVSTGDGMPSGKSGGSLINGTPPSKGGTPPTPPKGSNCKYEE